MSTATLIRGFSEKESEEAVEVLENSNIEFREIFSRPSNQSPVLITSSSAFSYKGIASIKSYCDYASSKFEKQD